MVVAAAMNPFVAIVAALAVGAQAMSADAMPRADQDHVKAIENGLLPAFSIKGRPLARMTLADEMRSSHTPAVSIAFFRNGRIVWAKAYGLADVASGRAATPDTLFQACSISKPVTAVGALGLVEAGVLDLDADVNDRLTGWKVPASAFTTEQKVTLRRLLSHTAGLTVHGFDGYRPGLALPTTIQTLDGSPPANSPPVVSMAVPGQRWAYSGGGYIVAQLLMTQAANQPFPALMQRLVLKPAMMVNSTYQQPLPADLAPRAATGYLWDGQPLPGRYNTYPEMAAAGLWTTPSDLAHFAIALQDAERGAPGAILRQSTAQEMLSPVLDDFGLGLHLNPPGQPPGFSHGGDNLGFKAELMAFTTGTREGVVIMTNGEGGRYLIPEVQRAVAATYGWPSEGPTVKTVTKLQPAALRSFAGQYQLADGHRFSILADDDHLLLSMPTVLGPEPIELLAEGPSSFFAASSGLTADFEVRGGAPDGRLKLGGLLGDIEAMRAAP